MHRYHNAEVIERALRKKGGAATLHSLPVYYSDDAALVRAAKQSGLRHDGKLTPRSVVRA